jgi:hypothetical protein
LKNIGLRTRLYRSEDCRSTDHRHEPAAAAISVPDGVNQFNELLLTRKLQLLQPDFSRLMWTAGLS